MADRKISEFDAMSSMSDADVLTVVSGGANKKITWADFKGNFPGQIYLSAQGGYPTAANGCEAASLNEDNIYTLNFDKDSDEHAMWKFAMPSDYDGGTIVASPRWTCATGDGGAGETVCWSISGRSFGDNEDYGGAMGTPKTSTDTWQADAYCHIGPDTAAITLAGTPAASEEVIIDCMRDVSGDDLGGDAELVGIMLTYTRA